jgi:hypothetical protein
MNSHASTQYGPEEIISTHPDITVFQCPASSGGVGGGSAPSYGIRGYKTSFNVQYLKGVHGQYDDKAKVWRFADLETANAAAAHVIAMSAEASSRKQAELPAFRPKKAKTSVTLDASPAVLQQPPAAVAAAAQTTTTARKRKETASSRQKQKKSQSPDVDENDTAPEAAEAAAATPNKKRKTKEPSTDDADPTDAGGPEVAMATAKPKAPRKKKPTLAAAAVAAAASSQPFPPLIRVPDPAGRREAWEVECSIAEPKVMSPTDYPCDSPPPRNAPPPHTPPPAPHKKSGHFAAVQRASASADAECAAASALPAMTREKWEVLRGVGSACTMNVTFRVKWKSPDARELSYKSVCQTIAVPCIVESFEIDERKRLDLWVRPTQTIFFEHVVIAGPIDVEITPDDLFRFRQRVPGTRSTDVRTSPLEVVTSPLWSDSTRDPLQSIAYTLNL